ncbi:MAG TPA: outer membrane lipoprotein-sorting protein [Candidatus Saccharimonadales bacterium]|nr:outer membrane lipoprotein-sorting protein [Candidatus Saccharimonadales bacterium]
MKHAVWSAALLAFCASSSIPQARTSAAQESPRWTTDSVLNKTDRVASDFRTLTADIEQIKYTAVVNDASSEIGKIFVRRDQKMRIDLAKPDPKTILRTGDSLFIYTPKINRVEEYNLGKHRDIIDQYMRLGFGTKSQDLRKSYDIKLVDEEEIDHRKALLLELTPRSEEVRKQITKIQMWVDESSWLPIQQKFFEVSGGDYFLVKYSNMMKNLKIDDSKFKPDWPKNSARVKPRQ